MPVFWVLAAIGLAGDDGEKPIAPEDGAPTGPLPNNACLLTFTFTLAKQGKQAGCNEGQQDDQAIGVGDESCEEGQQGRGQQSQQQ